MKRLKVEIITRFSAERLRQPGKVSPVAMADAAFHLDKK
jgi:hypothetical protein